MKHEEFGPAAPALESIIKVSGVVAAREPVDGSSPTGEVMIEADVFAAESVAKSPLVFDFRDEKLDPRERIRHRYLYLRNPKVHETFAFRTRAVQAMRRFLTARSFDEVDTPLLATRWTPDAPYLAIRGRKQIFALPGRLAIHPPILMASGFDRTFEVARRFARQKSYGPFEQPEYDVLELMMAWCDEGDALRFLDEMLADLWRTTVGADLKVPTVRLGFDEAWGRYGTDAPDVRFGLEFQDVTRLAEKSRAPALAEVIISGGAIRAVRVPAGKARLGEKDLAAIGKVALEAGQGAIFWLSHGEDGPEMGGTAAFDAAVAAEVLKAAKATGSDLVVVAAAKDWVSVGPLIKGARRELAAALKLVDPKRHALAFVTRLPYMRFDAATRRYALRGDPLARPVDGDIEGDPNRMRSQAFAVVLDGVEVASGAARNHSIEEQTRLFAALGLAPGDIDKRFGQLLRAMRFGTQPHARIGIGVDRLVALLRGLPSIDEVIPLPKTSDGQDPLARAPWPIEPSLVQGLFGV
jgi:aspartyl-tRNA synthetase